jgi:very-short-patch-repair endonuclease
VHLGTIRNRRSPAAVGGEVFTTPFLGSAAVALGLVTKKELRGPRFRRLFPNVYVAADVPVDLAVLSRAALLLAPGGVLGGWSAAELLGASCGPAGAPVEVVAAIRLRSGPGLDVRHCRLAEDEITEVGGIPVTTGRRTAYDLGRLAERVLAVVAVDALSRVCGFAPADLVAMDHRHLGDRGSRQLAEAIALADPRSESPMETRIRIAIHDAGLPAPDLQHPVGPYRLDLAYPAIRLGIEYDGRDHLTPQRALRDLDRQAHLTAAGWTVLRFGAHDVLNRPWRVARSVRNQLR